jgi:non-canonical poly(A) RNA polymerase PAPD5/7
MAYVQKKNFNLQYTIERLNEFIQESVKNSLGEEYQLKMYGSRATNLCLPWSDIDYVISCTKTIHFEPLKILADYLVGKNQLNKYFIHIKYIAGASIPLLKIYTNKDYQTISLDISIENPEHHGEECVNYIKEKIKEYEVLTPLTIALKTILQKAFLNDPYKGGLSSYGVTLLIIHFLLIQQKKGKDISIKSLGKLFYDILFYYGREYDITNPIVVDEKESMQKIIAIHQFQLLKNEFILVDPLNISNNVAKNTRQFQNIQLAFQIAYTSAKEKCECGCHYQHNGVNIRDEGCEHNLLNRIFNDVNRDWIF